MVLCEATLGQRARKRHENDQSNNRDNGYHNDHFWIVETLACDHKCSGDIALTGAKCHDALGVNVRSAKQPTNPDPKCDKEQSGQNPAFNGLPYRTRPSPPVDLER